MLLLWHMLGSIYMLLIFVCIDQLNHHSVHSVIYWQERDVYDILSSYEGRIYDSSNLETRRVVLAKDLNKLKLVDDEDNKIPIYTKDGYKLPHHLAAFNKNTPSHGVLVNLRNLRALFVGLCNLSHDHGTYQEKCIRYRLA